MRSHSLQDLTSCESYPPWKNSFIQVMVSIVAPYMYVQSSTLNDIHAKEYFIRPMPRLNRRFENCGLCGLRIHKRKQSLNFSSLQSPLTQFKSGFSNYGPLKKRYISKIYGEGTQERPETIH